MPRSFLATLLCAALLLPAAWGDDIAPADDIAAKARAIIIPELKLVNVTLDEACTALTALSKAHDPDNVGLQCNTSRLAFAAIMASFGEDDNDDFHPLLDAPPKRTKRFTLRLTQIPLADAVRYAELLAGEPGGVAIVPAGMQEEMAEMETLFYHAPIIKLAGGLAELTGIPLDDLARMSAQHRVFGDDDDDTQDTDPGLIKSGESALTAAFRILGVQPVPSAKLSYNAFSEKLIATHTPANLQRITDLLWGLYPPPSVVQADVRVIHVTDQHFLDAHGLERISWADVQALPAARREVIYRSATHAKSGTTTVAEDTQMLDRGAARLQLNQRLAITATSCLHDHVHASLDWRFTIKLPTEDATPLAELSTTADLVADDSGEFLLAVETPLQDGQPAGQYFLLVTLRHVGPDDTPIRSIDTILKAIVDSESTEVSP